MKKIVLTMLMGGSLAAQAADNLKFHGTLISPPNCTINNDQTIDVKFGNLLINKIDGTRYAQNVPYEITCCLLYTSPITVNEQSIPVLKAIPVKKSGASLKEGGFDATATLQVDYQ